MDDRLPSRDQDGFVSTRNSARKAKAKDPLQPCGMCYGNRFLYKDGFSYYCSWCDGSGLEYHPATVESHGPARVVEGFVSTRNVCLPPEDGTGRVLCLTCWALAPSEGCPLCGAGAPPALGIEGIIDVAGDDGGVTPSDD